MTSPFWRIMLAAIFNVAFFVFLTLPAVAAENLIIPAGAGHFQFPARDGNAVRSIAVWSYRPRRLTSSSAVLIVLPGARRDGERYRDQWRSYAERAAALLLVTEFSAMEFPGSRSYSAARPKGASSPVPFQYLAIEELFEQTARSANLTAQEYSLYGHSAGAQFVHRLLMFNPQARAKITVAANAGWYLMPDFTVEYPYGMKGSDISGAQLKAALDKKLIVLLGEHDTDPNHPLLNRSAGAMRQGRQRLERGENFYHTAQRAAASLDAPFHWQLQIVPNAAHSNSAMAPTAAALLLP